MNKHRLLRKSKKIQGRGFFSDVVGPVLKDKALALLREQLPGMLEEKAKTFVHDKLNGILSMKKKSGGGLKFI